MQELTDSKSEILIFECNRLEINPKEYWIEIIEVSFIKKAITTFQFQDFRMRMKLI